MATLQDKIESSLVSEEPDGYIYFATIKKTADGCLEITVLDSYRQGFTLGVKGNDVLVLPTGG